jgi:hypothetical protein
MELFECVEGTNCGTPVAEFVGILRPLLRNAEIGSKGRAWRPKGLSTDC